ncbi:MAG: hypothetical protein RIM99_06870 [Cyclobacteriaceae bacterium]
MKNFLIQLVAVFLFVLFQSCDEDSTDVSGCGVDDPLSELKWLSELKNDFDQRMQPAAVSITMYTYKEASVFEINSCIGCADNLVSVYNCEGEVICEFGGIAGLNTCEDFATTATNPVLLYSSTCDKVAVVDKAKYDQEMDFFHFISADISGDCLNVEYSSSGCSGDSWEMSLFDSGEILESFPVQRNIKLVLENKEACQAVFTKTISFDLTPLQLENYGEVILNLHGTDDSLFYLYSAEDFSLLTKQWSLTRVDGGLAGHDFSFDSGVIEWSFDGEKIEVINNNTDDTKEAVFLSGNYDFELQQLTDGWSLIVDGQNLGTIQIISAGEFRVDARSFDGYRLTFTTLH